MEKGEEVDSVHSPEEWIAQILGGLGDLAEPCESDTRNMPQKFLHLATIEGEGIMRIEEEEVPNHRRRK